MEENKNNDWPPPPFKTEELDYGPSWGVIVALIAVAFIVVNVIIVVLSFSAGG